MINIFKDQYWSVSQAFLVPLTGLSKSQKFPMTSYLFWDEYSIDNYQLILRFNYTDYDDFTSYCRKNIFPILDREGYLTESFDFEDFSLFVLDMSIWKFDIDMFIDGKYSKFSKDAKKTIIDFHKYYNKGPKIDIDIHAVLEPFNKFSVLGGITAIEYAADTYGLPLAELEKVGELGCKYDREKETLSIISDKVTEDKKDCQHC